MITRITEVEYDLFMTDNACYSETAYLCVNQHDVLIEHVEMHDSDILRYIVSIFEAKNEMQDTTRCMRDCMQRKDATRFVFYSEQDAKAFAICYV